MTWRTLASAFCLAAIFWCSALVLVGSLLIVHGVATRETVLTTPIFGFVLAGACWLFGRMRKGVR